MPEPDAPPCIPSEGRSPSSHRPARVASVRNATPADAIVVAGLRAEALAELAPLRGGALYSERNARPLPEAGAADRALWVGLLGEAVVGYLSGRTEELTSGRRLGVIDALYVNPGCRSVGVAEELMAVAVEWCRSRGCVGIDAIALPGARATKNFFEESGFTSRLLVMHHRL